MDTMSLQHCYIQYSSQPCRRPAGARRQIKRRTLQNNVMPCLLLSVAAASLLCRTAEAFVVSPVHTTTTNTKTSSSVQHRKAPFHHRATITHSTTSLNIMNLDWEQLVYNAESAASSLASSSLNSGSFLTSLPVMYGAGLLTSVSPCVWGLLPLTMSYISTAAGERSDKNAVIPTLAFAAGLACVFCTLGLVASLAGGVFGSSNTNTFGGFVVAALSSGVCLAMGLQLLNLVDLPLPSLELPTINKNNKNDNTGEILIDAKGNILSNDDKEEDGGSLVRTFLLGGSSALVASPCATPVLTSILAYVANAHNPALGALYLLGYTLGYSTPLLVVAATGGQALAYLKQESNGDSLYGKIAPWVTPLTAGVLLWYGTNGLLYALFGDPSLVALAPILE